MTTEELAELLLTYLYDLAEAAPHPNFLFSLNEFIPMVALTDREQLQQAIDHLGDRGLIILASFDALGGISAGITMEGSVFVEKGGETGVIEQYRRDPQTFVKAREASPAQPDKAEKPERLIVEEEKASGLMMGRAVEAILADIREILNRDNSLDEGLRQDLLADLDTLHLQIGRRMKNKAVIEALLENLSSLSSVNPLAIGLKSILQVYFK